MIATIAMPMAANEASAASSLRMLNTALVSYSTTYGKYPPAISNLGPSTSPSSTAAGLIDSVLATGSRSGYTFTYMAGPRNLSYSITADPTTPNVTGLRTFYTDQSGVIRADATGATATTSSTPIN